MKWSAWITVLAGVCLLAAPFATGYNTLNNVATAEAVVLGVLIAGLGLWTALGTEVPAYIDYLLMVCGAWSIIAPFALAYGNTGMARNSDVVVGIVVAAVAVYRTFVALPRSRPAALMPPAVQLQTVLARSTGGDPFGMSVGQLVEQLHEEAVQLHEEEHVADLLALAKAEKIAMEEVRCGLVAYTPESSLAP